MISLQELNPNNYNLTDEQITNQQLLYIAINKVRLAYNKPMIVTSGVRSMEDQLRINPSAPKSKHILGLAVDILDKDSELWKWCMINMQILIDAGLYLEDKKSTPNWIHFQVVAPRSGKRIFIP